MVLITGSVRPPAARPVSIPLPPTQAPDVFQDPMAVSINDAPVKLPTRGCIQLACISACATCMQVPDEFQDPIMAVLMEDPVQLPTSGYIMDRAQVGEVVAKLECFLRSFLSRETDA